MPNSDSKYWALDATSAATVLARLSEATAPADTSVKADASTFSPSSPLSVTRQGSVAVVSISGPLTRSAVVAWWGDMLSVGYDALAATLKDLESDPSVKAIMLDIDSPGGSVAGVQELADIVAGCARKKPCAAYTNSLCASAAYWLASSTGRVFATETSEVGSIGVVMTLVDSRRAAEKSGRTVTLLTAGRYKGVGSEWAELSDADRQYFQTQLDGIHSVFRGAVASRMGIDAPAEEWGDAQVFLGREAQSRGLVTAVVSGLAEAVTLLSKESIMTRDELEASSPDLVRELLAEGEAKAKADIPTLAEFFACLKPFMAEADAERAGTFIEKCSAAQLSLPQMTVMADMLAPVTAKAAAPVSADDAKAEILKALQAQSAAVPAATVAAAPATAGTYRAALIAAASGAKE